MTIRPPPDACFSTRPRTVHARGRRNTRDRARSAAKALLMRDDKG